jgi:hypothetical protein
MRYRFASIAAANDISAKQRAVKTVVEPALR